MRVAARLVASALGAILAAALVACAGAGMATAAEGEPTTTATATATAQAPAGAERTWFPLRPDDTGELVGLLQRRLAWLGSPIDGTELAGSRLGPSTVAALRAFQGKFALLPSDEVTKRTWDAIARIAPKPGALPARCATGTVICVDVSQRLVRLVRDGEVELAMDARFGIAGQETRLGSFRVHQRNRDHVSSIYGMPMPYALFFSGDQAIHYSRYFARDGYAGASHGCVNVRDRAKAAALFRQAPLGTPVVVHR